MFELQLFDFNSVMNEDLEPFEKHGGIKKEQFDRSRNRGTHYQIISHRLYRESDCMFPFRLVVSQMLSLLNNIVICILFMSYISITQYTTAVAILSVHLSPPPFIYFIYYKIVHEVHDRQTYSKNNESSKSGTKRKHQTKRRL